MTMKTTSKAYVHSVHSQYIRDRLPLIRVLEKLGLICAVYLYSDHLDGKNRLALAIVCEVEDE